MTYQQANFVKNLVDKKTPLNEIAELFYSEFGETEACNGPEKTSIFKGRRVNIFTNFQGNDVVNAASFVLRKRL
jgi:hypothetical protein